jgi:hypothetical protein
MKPILIKQSFIGNLIYFLHFFVFIVYQKFLYLEIITPFLGAYWGNMSLFLLFPLLFTFIFFGEMTVVRITKVDKLVLVFLLFLTLNLIFNTFLSKDLQIILARVAGLLQFMSIYFIFRLANLDSSLFIKTNRIYWLVLTVLFSYSYIDSILNLTDIKVHKHLTYLVSYQLLAMVYLLISLIMAIQIKTFSLRIVMYLLSLTTLFLIGSRSELIGMFIGVCVIESVLNSLPKKMFFGGFFLVTLYGGILLASMFNPESRILLLFSGDQDGSVDQRNILLEQGMETINNNIISGDFGSHKPGEYIHNVFSAWVDLGFFGFLFFLFVLSVPFIMAAFKVYIKKQKSLNLILALSFLTISFILVIAAKNYTYLLLPVGLGIYSNYMAERFKRKVNN